MSRLECGLKSHEERAIVKALNEYIKKYSFLGDYSRAEHAEKIRDKICENFHLKLDGNKEKAQ